MTKRHEFTRITFQTKQTTLKQRTKPPQTLLKAAASNVLRANHDHGAGKPPRQQERCKL